MDSFKEQLQNIKNKNNSYSKLPKTFDEQLEILQNKGLIIRNKDFALKKLSSINYYRLSAYFEPFEYGKTTDRANIFLDDVKFEDIVSLYDFDIKLRMIVFEAIEEIEIYIRTQITYCHSQKYGTFGYLQSAHFKRNHNLDFDELMTSIQKDVRNALKHETFALHFKRKYNTTNFPIWAMVEVISISTLSKLYKFLTSDDKKEVIKEIPNINKDIFENWLHALSVVRNICAHHSRLWNKTLSIKFVVPKNITFFQNIRHDKSFFALSVISYILNFIGDKSDFVEKIKNILEQNPKVNAKSMGFIDDWSNTNVWK
jgi:abortive infection bacteriophage resistance protein